MIGFGRLVGGGEKIFCVYFVANRSRVLYVGFTGNLKVRVRQHREGRFEGFTSEYGCDRLVWFERFTTPSAAIAREKQIKRWRREKKVFLIERENPTLRSGRNDSLLRCSAVEMTTQFRVGKAGFLCLCFGFVQSLGGDDGGGD
jgi:putative endonuclease